MGAPSIAFLRRKTAEAPLRLPDIGGAIERWLEAERDQLPLWIPVALGAGIAAWFGLPNQRLWVDFLGATGVVGLIALLLARKGRFGQAIAWGALATCVGCGLAWVRSDEMAAPVLARAQVVQVSGTILMVERLPARESIRLTVVPDAGLNLPPKVRVSLDQDDEPCVSPVLPREGEGAMPSSVPPSYPSHAFGATSPSQGRIANACLVAGAKIAVKARLVPPPTAAVPGAYDYARIAWFQGIGATGKAMGPISVTTPAAPGGGFQRWLDGKRGVLTRHIESEVPGNAGGVAAAFVTGDVGGIDLQASDDFRRSGLAHLLSISGLHVAAAIAAAMLITLRLLALSQWLALRAPLTLISAGMGALAGIAYTLLSGAEVPTVRSCVASLLVLGGIALGREAMTLRLVATGALVVLLFRPEALIGPSFQLSFAAVTAIVALYELPKVRELALKRDESWPRKIARELVSLLVTGFLVEAALAPIALYHFHRDGLYGAFANIIAIPLSTFVIMPAEALALLFDLVGLGGPIWWVAGLSVRFLLWIAHVTASLPGSVAALPSMPLPAFLSIEAGFLWLALWRRRWRLLGLLPAMVGAVWALATPAPDLLVTGDGKHVAVRDGSKLYLLRPRAGDYVRDFLGWGAGIQGTALDLDAFPTGRCSDDSCVAALKGSHLLATRSPYRTDWDALIKACGWADIAVSDRRLPRSCSPRWLKLDAPFLSQSGGLASQIASRSTESVNGVDRHPWVQRLTPRPDRGPYRRPQ